MTKQIREYLEHLRLFLDGGSTVVRNTCRR